MSVNSKMTAIADAIRNLLDISGTMGLDAMASNIRSITKRGAVAGTISTKEDQYIIPAGYHNGNGTVGISSDEQAKLIAENIKNGVTILGVSGTASGDIYAIIAVTYPEGSTCTCSDGTKTLKAKDTSGKALFNVTAGEWTVSCTDGSSTASQAVSITAENQTVSVTLSFAYYVYNYGDLCTENSGGWKGQNATTSATNKADHLYINSNNAPAMAGPNNKVDVTRYKTMVIEAELVGNYPGATIGLISSYTGVAAAYVQPSTIRQVQEIDISALSGEYYPYVARSDALSCNLYMVKFL